MFFKPSPSHSTVDRGHSGSLLAPSFIVGLHGHLVKTEYTDVGCVIHDVIHVKTYPTEKGSENRADNSALTQIK